MEITRLNPPSKLCGAKSDRLLGGAQAGKGGFCPKTWRETALWGLALTAGAMAFSIVLGEALLGATLLIGLIWVIRERPVLIRPLTSIAAGLYVLWALLSLVLGPESNGWGKSPRLVWLLALPLTALVIRTREEIHFLLKALAWGCGVLALRVMFEHPFLALRGPGDFMALLIDQGSMTAGQMLMVGCVVTAGLWSGDRSAGRSGRKWLVLLILLAAALVINLKRGSWICAVVILAVFFGRRLGWKTPIYLAGLAALLFLIPAVRQRVVELPREFDAGRGGRMTMWCKIAPELIRRNPWGIGYGALTNRLMREVAPEVEMNRNHLHSNPVQVTVELGWLGLGLYLLWHLAALFQAWRTYQMTGQDVGVGSAILAVVGLILNGLVEYNLGDTELLVVYAILFGLLSAGIVLPSTCAGKRADR